LSADLRAAARAFGAKAEPIPLARGTWRAGALVLKEALGRADLWAALAEVAAQAKPNPAVRIARPLRSLGGTWVAEGCVAWDYLDGQEEPGRYRDKLDACDAFTAAFAEVARPAYFDLRDDPWCRADRFAWGEAEAPRDRRFAPLVDPLRERLLPVALPSRLVHGDIAGNLIFAEGLPPGVIDLTLYWRPAGFAKAVLIVDALAWESADAAAFSTILREEPMPQLLLRAALRRILEQQEHILAFGKDPATALSIAEAYRRVLTSLRLL